MLRQRRPSLEALAPRPDGPRLPLPEAHRAPLGRCRRAPCRRRRAACRQRRRSRSSEGRARHYAPRSQGSYRQAAAAKEGKEVTYGTEGSSLRFPPWLQQALEVALVCRPRVRRPAPRRREAAPRAERPPQVRGCQLHRYRTRCDKLVVRIYTARPGIIIGRKGAEIDKLKQEVQKRTKREVHIDIQEVHRPELDAQLVAESIALQLEKRVAFRRAMRKSVDSALRFGCKGIKVRVAGRLNGAEIARKEWYLQGRLPLQTLRADIDFGFAQAYTTYGVI